KNVRSKYSRPCDACSLRKVKCDLKQPSCTRCLEHGLPCTNNRVRKKCGPKHIHSKTRESILEMSGSTQRYYVPLISLKHLLPCLQVYQTWFYGVWPVVSVAYLMSKVVSTPGAAYSLSCAVSAAIIVQVTFLSSSSAKMMNLPEDVKHSTYANEAIRARDAINYRLHPSPETLLTSFFLHAYYINIKGGAPAAIVYLREAISIAQILGLHNSNTFIGKSLAEVHRLRKIYYLLLVTERFICIEDDIPVILEPSIPFPSLEDEEYSSLLTGFTELVKVFAIPDKKFFDKFMTLKMNENEYASFPSQTWIINVQQQLESIRVLSETLSIQKLNILLSKYWMKSLTWNISRKNNLLLSKASTDNTNSSLSTDYPFVMAKDFLSESKDLPLFAFESNGPGVCIKLLELGNSLADSISLTRDYSGFEYLSSIFALVSKLKNDITLPLHLYQKIENML
ncbi:Probable sucrose utilization protein (SUC1) or maltose fermentation regulatory protein (MAL13), partial [Scheffersomyces stipitis CBS 6054]